MKYYVPAIILAIVLFVILYDIYKTKRYARPRQIIWAIVGAIALAYILYTCRSDNPSSEKTVSFFF